MISSLSAGDFDDNGFADLAVGDPSRTINNRGSAGAVEVFYCSTIGLFNLGQSQLWHQDHPGLLDDDGAERFDLFGDALAAGDFDGDGTSDLAVGVPGEAIVESRVPGLQVIYGSANGLSATAGPATSSGHKAPASGRA